MKAKKLLALALALVMILGLAVSPVSVRAAGDANPYIADLIGYYKSYQEAAETDILRTLDAMAQVDPVQAEAWTQIMDYWSYINTEMQVNIGTVPEGLPEDNSVAIVILGFALNSDGTMKDELIGRLETGLAVAEAYPNSYVVVTGGGTASGNPNVTEGGLMGQWLLEHGLSEDRLIIENKAPSTVGNAENTYKILAEEYPQVDSFVMVTSDYHVPRGCILFYAKCLLAAYAAGGEPLKLISNAGFGTGSNGYESISLQASGVAQVAGVKATSSSKLTLSTLTGIAVEYTSKPVVTAIYDNGYTRDVTDKAIITGYDPALGAKQTVTVSYTENGVTKEGTFTLNAANSYVSDLIGYYKQYQEAAQTDINRVLSGAARKKREYQQQRKGQTAYAAKFVLHVFSSFLCYGYAFSLEEKVAFAEQMTDEGLPKTASSSLNLYFYSLTRIPSSVGFAASFSSEGEALPLIPIMPVNRNKDIPTDSLEIPMNITV